MGGSGRGMVGSWRWSGWVASGVGLVSITLTYNRKQIATAVARTGSDADVRSTAPHMTHSLKVHRASYQQTGDATSAVDRYLNLHESSI